MAGVEHMYPTVVAPKRPTARASTSDRDGPPTGSPLLGILSGEDDGRNVLLGRIPVSDHDVEEGDDDARERHREYHGKTAEDDSDQGHRDENDERREANGVPENPRNDEVVLEEANPENKEAGDDGEMRRDRKAHADRDDARDERSR